jgi:phosphonate transport system ATP-binding protein
MMRGVEPALRIVGLSKSFGQSKAVDDVSFSVRPGEVVALLGPSGSGKSTIFRCITQLARLDTGEVHVLGTRMDTLRGSALRRHRRSIGLIFQQFNLIGRLSALDNVLAGRLGSVGPFRATFRAFKAEDRQAALAALDRVGLLAKSYQRADSLSGGQQQRVAIARVVAQQAGIILADEPVASLDPSAADNVMKLLEGIARERGIAVVCSLHQTALAKRFATRIVALRGGRVFVDQDASAISQEQLHAIYATTPDAADAELAA